MRFGPNSEWREEIKIHHMTWLQIVEIKNDEMVATHVHISSYPEGCWSLEQAKQIAKTVIHFDEAFQQIWAPSRREHLVTQSNKRDNYLLKNLKFEECSELIDKCANKKDLFKIMQAGVSKKAPPTRDFAWNFQNAAEDGIGSIGVSHDS